MILPSLTPCSVAASTMPRRSDRPEYRVASRPARATDRCTTRVTPRTPSPRACTRPCRSTGRSAGPSRKPAARHHAFHARTEQSQTSDPKGTVARPREVRTAMPAGTSRMSSNVSAASSPGVSPPPYPSSRSARSRRPAIDSGSADETARSSSIPRGVVPRQSWRRRHSARATAACTGAVAVGGVSAPSRWRARTAATRRRTVATLSRSAASSTYAATVAGDAGRLRAPRAVHHAAKSAQSLAYARSVAGARPTCAA